MISDIEIQRFGENLLLIRQAVGWSAEEFGDRVGLTRQTINSLENGKYKLTKIQYIAMRSILDDEMEKFPDETSMLNVVLQAFVDTPEKYSEDARDKIKSKVGLFAPAIIKDHTKRKEASKEWLNILTALGILATGGILAIVIGLWRKK